MADLDERTLELASLESEACVTIRVFKPSTSTSGTLFYVLREGVDRLNVRQTPRPGKTNGCTQCTHDMCGALPATPEHPYPAPLQDCLEVLRNFYKTHQSNLAIARDSADANLVTAFDQRQHQQQERRSDELVLVCGVLDLELESNQSMIEFATGHPYNGIE